MESGDIRTGLPRLITSKPGSYTGLRLFSSRQFPRIELVRRPNGRRVLLAAAILLSDFE